MIVKCGKDYIDTDKINDQNIRHALSEGLIILLKRRTLRQDLQDNLQSAIVPKPIASD